MRRTSIGLLFTSLLAFLPANAQDAQVFAQSVPSGVDNVVRISAFSGKPVPRFESLKYASVHGRTGPSLEYPIAWRYERRGLPVLIIKESRDWRMVRDPNGDEVWMHERTLGGHPSVLAHGEGLIEMRHQPSADARVIARVEPGAVLSLLDCQGAFCEVAADRKKGWVARSHLWGAPGTAATPVEDTYAHLSSESVESQ